MKNIFEKLQNLSKKRLNYFISKWDKNQWFQGSKAYWEGLEEEIQEAKNELDTNQVYLEDELWDVLWDYLCLLNSLEKEGKISSVEKVLERAYTKYSGRINTETWENNWKWEEIKEKQKKLLKEEVEK